SLTAPSLSSSHHLPTTEIYTLSLHDALPISLNLVLLKGCAVLGVFWGAWVRHAPEQYKAALDELVRWCVQGRLSCHIQQVYSLSETPKALKALTDGKVMGKLVVRP